MQKRALKKLIGDEEEFGKGSILKKKVRARWGGVAWNKMTV